MVLANAGTPLLWFGCCWPLIGSVGVAVVEWSLIQRIRGLRTGKVWSLPIVIGNLVTSLVGLALVNWSTSFLAFLSPRPLEHANLYLVGIWLLAFSLTVLIEWPFVRIAFKEPAKWRPALLQSLAANLVTYALLVTVATALGANSLAFDVDVVSPDRLRQSVGGWVFYVDPSGKEIRQVRLDGTRDGPVAAMPEGMEGVSVEAFKEAPASLVAYTDSGDRRIVTIKPNLGPTEVAASYDGQVANADLSGYRSSTSIQPCRSFDRFSRTPDVGCMQGYWPEVGLRAYWRTKKVKYRVAVGVPALSWISTAATAIPDGHIVSRLGPQIVILDIEGRRMAWLANGYSPTVVLDQPYPFPPKS